RGGRWSRGGPRCRGSGLPRSSGGRRLRSIGWTWIFSLVELPADEGDDAIEPRAFPPTRPVQNPYNVPIEPFSTRLRRLRRAAHLTQEELAARAGYSPDYVSMLERGLRAPPPQTVDILAKALRLEATDREALLDAAVVAPSSRELPLQTRHGPVRPAA